MAGTGRQPTRPQVALLGVEIARDAQQGTLALYANNDSMQDEEHPTDAPCGQTAAHRARQRDGLRIDIAVVHEVCEEPRIGAEPMIAFAGAIEGWSPRTHPLAKRAELGRRIDAREWLRAQPQAGGRLDAAVESFVMACSKTPGSCMFPGLAVAVRASRDLFDLDRSPFPAFSEGVCRGFVVRDSALPPGVRDEAPGPGARPERDTVVGASCGAADSAHGLPEAPLAGTTLRESRS